MKTFAHPLFAQFICFCGAVAVSCAALLLATSAVAHAVEKPDGFGAEANPTGQPIGGGAGYTAASGREQAQFHAGTLTELQDALRNARAGEVVWIESGSSIDLADAQLAVPERVTLAGDLSMSNSLGPLLTSGMSKFEWRIRLKPGARLTGVRLRGPNPLMRGITHSTTTATSVNGTPP